MKCLVLDILNQAPRSESASEIPVWLMRQAGRYMPEYRELKSVHGFLGLCHDPALATEVTLQPIRRFGPDAAIIFADIMLPAECLDFSIAFAPGPVVANAIDSPERITDIPDFPSLDRVSYVFEAISLCRQKLTEYVGPRGRKALFGFAAAPWTLACYLLKQEPYKHFAGTTIFAAKHPEQFEMLLEKLCTLTIEYCRAQVAAGADAIQIFDSWAGLLSADDYASISAPHTERLISAVQQVAPVVLFAHGAAHLMPLVAQSEARGISVDWRVSLVDAARCAPDKIIQGNLDPSKLFASQERLAREVEAMLASAPRGRYIANLGHGVLQQTPVERVAEVIAQIQRQ